jgi:hypothetical protein
MRKLITVFLLLATASFLFAADDNNVTYTGGTASQVKEGTAGRFDFSAAGHLQFISAGTVLAIPYNSIESFEHSKEAAVHLGVAPAIAVGLVAARRHNHFVRITYRDSNQLPQVAVFEVPKSMTAYLMPMLGARSPQAQCSPYQDCPARPISPRPPIHTAVAPAPQPAASK